MRIKKAAEAKHEATRSPATSDFVQNATSSSLVHLLRSLQAFPKPWSEPRGDLYHWIPLLNTFDHILEEANSQYKLSAGPQTQPFGTVLLVQGLSNEEGVRTQGSPEQGLRDGEDDERLICLVLDFTRFLLDNCANRSLYNSSEQVNHLLNSTSLLVTVSTLHLGARLAATYYRSASNRPQARHSLSTALLHNHYRLDPERVQKLADQFSANLQKTVDSLQPQTPSGKGKETSTPAKKASKQTPKIHPNDLLAFVKDPRAAQGDFSEFSVVCFDTHQGASKSCETLVSESPNAPSIHPPSTPTPARRPSAPSRLSRSTGADDAALQEPPIPDAPSALHKLVIQPQAIKNTDIHEILSTNFPKIPADLHYAFMVKIKLAKALSTSPETRQQAVAVRLLGLTNIAFLYPETMFQQKVLHQDSTEPKQLQIVHQLAELSRPPTNAAKAVPIDIVAVALEALEAIATRHRTKHSDIISALGINITHGTLFQLLRSIVNDLQSERELETTSFEIHETIFGMLDNLLPKPDTRSSTRTVDTLVSTGLFGVLVEILNIHSEKAQRTQNRVLLFVNEGMHVIREGIQAFANAGGLDAVSELVAWEVKTCLEAVSGGQGLPLKLKSRVMDYEVPIWNQQTLRTVLKLINHMLGHSNATNDRLLRNLIDTPSLLRAMNEILRNGKIFGSNIYGQAINMVSTFLNNEPTSYSVIAEAGLSRSLLDSVCGGVSVASAESIERKTPINRVAGRDEVTCGVHPESRTLSIARLKDKELAKSILCSSDVMSNLPQSFGALCLNSAGMHDFLNSTTLESYFEVFESPAHIKVFSTETQLAETVGTAFDELVRHHPSLKAAVIYNVILTIARVDYRCRYLIPLQTQAKIAKNEAQTSVNEHETTSPQDAIMTGSADTPSSSVYGSNPGTDKEPDAIAYVGTICKFLMTFFHNQGMASAFVEQGGLTFLLDLCSLPTLSYDSVKLHGYGGIYSLSKAVHMVVDIKPQIALPVILKYSSDALDQVRPLYEHDHKEPYFGGLVGQVSRSAVTDASDIKALLQLQVYIHLLQEVFSGHVSGRERNLNLFTAINLTDMYVDVIRRLGLLSRFCIWELANILGDLPNDARSKTELRLDGYGDEANQVMGIRHAISLRLPPTVNGEASSTEVNASSQGLSAESRQSALSESGRDASSLEFSADQLKTIKAIRHLMTEMPRTIFSFLHNLGEKLVPRKRLDAYQRQSAFMVAETIAQAAVEVLSYQRVNDSDRVNRRNSYWTMAVEQIRTMLNIGTYFDDPSAPGCSTMLLPAFRNRGGLALLLNILQPSLDIVTEAQGDLSNSSYDETPQAAAATSSANINLILTMLDCLCSAKHVCQTPQANIMQVAGADQTHPFVFHAGQFIVDLRFEILPVVERLWNSKGSEKLPPSSRKKIIHILRTILEADHEQGAARRSQDVVLRQPVPHVPYKPSERRNILSDSTYDADLVREAVYRCPGDRDRQADYCALRQKLPLPRFPVPAYDQDTGSDRASAAALRRDSQTTIPDPDLTENSRTSTPSVLGTRADPSHQPTTESAEAETSRPETDSDDPAGRMAMSIDNLLNLSETGQAAAPTTGQIHTEEMNHPEAVEASPPVEFVLSSTKISLEDLEKLRGPLRKHLISRVMDMLAVKDDRLTFDLAELLSTAASKAPTPSAMKETRAEFGETMIQALISFNSADDFRDQQENISAIANLLAILLQERDFYEACIVHLKEHIESLLDFIQVFPSSSSGESYPWIGHVLLIFEKLLSEELQPEQVVWHPPAQESTAEPSDGHIAGYADPIFTDDQRERLSESILPVLPHVGKDKSLALSIVRVLVMVTRHRTIADKLATKNNLQRLFLMMKQLAGQMADKLQNAFMLILRHISEDDDSIRKTMRNHILTSFRASGTRAHHETTSFVRNHYALVLRSPKIFLEVVNEILKLRSFDAETRPQVLILKADVTPDMFTPWEPPTAAVSDKAPDDEKKLLDTSANVVETTEEAGRHESPEKPKPTAKAPVVEHPGGLVHFLLSQLLVYKDTNDQEASSSRPQKGTFIEGSSDVEMDYNDNTSDDEPAAPHANPPSVSSAAKSELKKEEYKAEDHPIYQYRCFLLQCLTELLMSYNQAKIEFINFSRKADPKAMTPSKPKSGVLNYLLSGLIPVDSLERSTSVGALKRQGTSTWASSVVVALCMRTPELMSEIEFGEKEARDSDLLFVRKFVIEHAAKAYRDVQSTLELAPEVRYARMLSLSDLFHRILIGRTLPIHSTAPKVTGEYVKGQETEVARIMFEKNLISVLTASLSEIDLNVPSAKRAVKYILRPLKLLTQTALLYSQNSDLSTTPGQSTEEDDISTATSVSDVSEEREETPDLFRHSALGMLEPGREEEESSSESDDEDEEMYDEEYDDGLDYDEAMDQVDDDEAVSDPDDEEMGSEGGMEGMPGDMPLNMEVVIDGEDEASEDEDEEDDEDNEDDDDDDGEDDDDGDDIDEDDDIEILDEIEHGDGNSLDGDNEDDWEDELDESNNATDSARPTLPGLDPDIFGQINVMPESFAERPDGHGLAAIAGGGAFASLANDVENGTFMSDLRLVREEDGEDEEAYPEDDEDVDDPEDEEGEGDFMYETYGDEEDEPFGMMDETFGFLGGTGNQPPPHFFNPGFRRGDVLVTPDGRSNLFRTMRTHTRAGNERHVTEDGVNPLLQRSTEPTPTFHHRHRRPGPFEMVGTTSGGLEFLRMMRASEDLGAGSMISQMLNGFAPGGGLAGAGSMWATVRQDDLEILLGHERHRDWPTRDQRHRRDDVSQPPPFTPASTVTRWQEAARLLYAQSYVEKVNRILNSMLKLLVPQAMDEAAQRQEDELRIQREREIEAERIRKEKEERQAQEDAERQEREREEQQRREEEAARQVAAAETSHPEGPASEAMEGIETTENENTTETEEAAAGPLQQAPRVVVAIRGRQIDITDLGIDQEYLEALPAELREEVIMQAVQERRSQQPQTTAAASTSETPSNVDPAFLDALPEELRQEIIQQEEHAQRRRDRQEQRRREQEAAGTQAAAEDMDIGSVLASLDPLLRRQVLMEQALSGDADILNQLPEHLQQEARALLEEPEFRNMNLTRRLGQLGHTADALAMPAYNRDTAARRVQRKQIVQMLDKPGIATILRLLFIPQTGSLKESLNLILQNLAQNRQSRAELISLLLSILQDGSSDEAAVERSYATLTMRSKQPAGQQQTPRPPKRTITGSFTAPLGTEMTHMMVIQQCLAALVALVQNNGHAQTFFLNPHETSSSLKNKGKQKGKSKEDASRKYALNALLSLLDRKLIMENANCMEQLSQLLIRVTQPLNLLRRQEKDEGKTSAVPIEADSEPIIEPTGSSDQTDDAPPATEAAVETPNAQPGQPSDGGQNREDAKKSKTPAPPTVPQYNLQLVINIVTAKECSSKIFRDTLSTINNLSAIPGAKDIFGRELVRQARQLGSIIASDLAELLTQLSKEAGTTVQSAALSKFSSPSSDQTKLLRVLMALDYVFQPKQNSRPRGPTSEDGSGSKTKNALLSSLHESTTFTPAWQRLSDCLKALREKDNMMNIATMLSPLIEALMVVCKSMDVKDQDYGPTRSQQFTVASPEPESSMDILFFRFTEEHRKILNDLVRNNPRLMSGTFSLLVNNSKVLDFDNKRNYFTRRMHTRDETRRAHPPLSFTVRRGNIFPDSYQKLFFKKPEEVKYGKLNIKFTGEEGVDAGGVTREWFQAMTRQFFNENYALFVPVAADKTTFHPSSFSWVNPEHLHYFKFIGRIIGKALYEGRPLDCHFSRAVYKKILGKAVSVKDMESQDLSSYKSYMWMLENDISEVTFETFSTEQDAFGETQIIDLIPDGRNIPVTNENKQDWVQKIVEYRLTGSVSDQLASFLQGFHEIVPGELIRIFNEQELELLISGLPEIDIDDWRANTDYQNFNATSAQVQWFWRAVRSFDKEERAKLLQFVTGTSKVPLNGFKELEGMNGYSKFNIHRDYGDKDRLPSSHTCFNQLDLPEYDDYETLRSRLYTAMTAGGEYFGFA